MNFRSYADLAASISLWQHQLPRDFTLICGVPRSGLVAANILALQWNLPLADVDGVCAGRMLSGGRRLAHIGRAATMETAQKILVVDDSVHSGESIELVREKMSLLSPQHQVSYAAVYATPAGTKRVDYYAEVVSAPRIFEWNLFHHSSLGNTCVDIDGVLCVDPTDEENDDGERYREFLRTAKPKYIPTAEVGWLVTSRLEKYRPETESWLARHGVAYRNLCMLNLPDMHARRATGAGATFKAEQYSKSGAAFFIESHFNQAVSIAELTKKPILAIDRMIVAGPDGLHAMKQNMDYQVRRLKRGLKRYIHAAREYSIGRLRG